MAQHSKQKAGVSQFLSDKSITLLKGAMLLIVKERTIPLRIKCDEALLRRLPSNHSKNPEVKQDLAKRRSGYLGEKSIDYYLSFLHKKRYNIFHDIRLTNDNYAFQIDTLIIADNFALIVEVKNLKGTLYFDNEHKQLIQKNGHIEIRLSDPLAQVKRQQWQLAHWLGKRQIALPPIEYLVVISDPKTILKSSPDGHHIFEKIIHAEHVPEKVKKFEDVYQKQMLSPKTIGQLNHLLLDEHKPHFFNAFRTYGVLEGELIKGVQCLACGSYPMTREFGKWTCTSCQAVSKDAHKQAILDYLAFHPTITNQQCREFFELSSRKIATTLLNSMQLSFSGIGKGRVYHRPPM